MEHFFGGGGGLRVVGGFRLTAEHVLVIQRHDLDEERQGGIPVGQQGSGLGASGAGRVPFHQVAQQGLILFLPDGFQIHAFDVAAVLEMLVQIVDEGRAAAAQYPKDAYDAEPERWNNCPDMMDCDPWEPPAETDTANE